MNKTCRKTIDVYMILCRYKEELVKSGLASPAVDVGGCGRSESERVFHDV